MRPRFRFTPLVKIASGGSATVYVGARARGGTRVALKRPHAHVLEDPRQRREILREATVAASLHHPNVVAVREIEAYGDEVQLVMDYVEGAALGSLIAREARRERTLPPAVAVRAVLDACEGLAAVHAARDEAGALLGLVHRDISPQNILVGVDGRARVTDFGLAKAIYGEAPSTTQGTLKGKLGYMAPEYIDRGEVDYAVDVFAMGVVLWEALAGLRLFRGDNEAQTLDRLLREDPPLLGATRPDLAPFDAVIARATNKNPRARYPSASELSAAIREAAATRGLLASEDEVGGYVRAVAGVELAERDARVRAALSRRRRPLVVVAVGAGLLAAGASLLALHAGAPEGPRANASSSSTPAVTAPPVLATTEAPRPPPPPPSASTPPGVSAASSTSKPRPPRPLPGARDLPPNPYDRPRGH